MYKEQYTNHNYITDFIINFLIALKYMPIFCASAQKNGFKEMYSLNCHFANQ